MRAWRIEELALLPREEAVQRARDTANAVTWRRLMRLAAVSVAIAAIPLATEGLVLGVAVLLLNLAAVVAALWLDGKGLLDAMPRQTVLITLVGQFVLLAAIDPTGLSGLRVAAFVLPLVTLLFRLRAQEHLLLYGGYVGVTQVGNLAALAAGIQVKDEGATVAAAFLSAFCLLIALATGKRFKGAFLKEWEREAGHARERERLRDELERARSIQLSMLPRQAPELAWLDIAGLSLPATEVGGDYYGYLEHDPAHIGLVVADVAGHGVAAGLMLSGLRSCLYLLRDRVSSPGEMLDNLSRMVRLTARMLVTAVYAELDGVAGRVSYATAGNPAPLHWRAATGELVELPVGAPPLGTRLPHAYVTREAAVACGDVLVLYTDGILETNNLTGEDFGIQRLLASVTRAVAAGGDARAIREALLTDLWNHKGTAPQADDVTMVIVRVLRLAAA
jgi:hypothetical protein